MNTYFVIGRKPKDTPEFVYFVKEDQTFIYTPALRKAVEWDDARAAGDVLRRSRNAQGCEVLQVFARRLESGGR